MISERILEKNKNEKWTNHLLMTFSSLRIKISWGVFLLFFSSFAVNWIKNIIADCSSSSDVSSAHFIYHKVINICLIIWPQSHLWNVIFLERDNILLIGWLSKSSRKAKKTVSLWNVIQLPHWKSFWNVIFYRIFSFFHCLAFFMSRFAWINQQTPNLTFTCIVIGHLD